MKRAPFKGKQLSPSDGFLREGLSRAREQSAFNDKAVVKSRWWRDYTKQEVRSATEEHRNRQVPGTRMAES